jgi:glyoxalase family protein
MKLQGLHHITMITADAKANVEFYGDVLGLRLVKKTVNFDAPEAYHLYFGDEQGSPGSILTWFEFAGAPSGRAGNGMIHTLQLGVGSEESLGFWEQRLRERGHASERTDGALRFRDDDGLQLELVVADPRNAPLRADHPEVPEQHRITGLEGARAFGLFHGVEERLLTDLLGFSWLGDGAYVLEGGERSFRWTYDPVQADGRQGAGTVHHIAWHSTDEDHLRWQAALREAGGFVTDVRDRDYFNAIYFREPRGILFELATTSPGFAVDEDPEHLGEGLRLPTQHEHLRPQLERSLQPLVAPRTAHRQAASA